MKRRLRPFAVCSMRAMTRRRRLQVRAAYLKSSNDRLLALVASKPSPGHLARHRRLAFEHRIASQPHDVSHVVALAPVEHPMSAEPRVPPKHDANPRPCPTQPLDQQRQYPPSVLRTILVRTTKVGHQQLLTAEHVQRHETVAVIVPVEEGARLMTVHRIVGRVEVEHQLLGRARERGNELFDQLLMNRNRPLVLGAPLEPTQRRGTRQAAVVTAGGLNDRVLTKGVVGRSNLRIPTRPRGPSGAPSSPPRGEPSRAGVVHRADARPARSAPSRRSTSRNNSAPP